MEEQQPAPAFPLSSSDYHPEQNINDEVSFNTFSHHSYQVLIVSPSPDTRGGQSTGDPGRAFGRKLAGE